MMNFGIEWNNVLVIYQIDWNLGSRKGVIYKNREPVATVELVGPRLDVHIVARGKILNQEDLQFKSPNWFGLFESVYQSYESAIACAEDLQLLK